MIAARAAWPPPGGNEASAGLEDRAPANFRQHSEQYGNAALALTQRPSADNSPGALRAAPTGKWDKSNSCASDGSTDMPIALVRVARENNDLYDRFAIDNEDDWALVCSIREHGIQEPLVLSLDRVLLSGHRRLAAAKYTDLLTVPTRYVDVTFCTLGKHEQLQQLRLFNQQRDKSFSERVREALTEIDPAEAHSKLLDHRIRRLIVKSESNVPMGAVRKRAQITTMAFLHAAQRVIERNRRYWPLIVRRVHYLMLNEPPVLMHDRKPGSHYVNNPKAYKALTNLLVRARIAGLVPMEAIEDPSRPILLGGGFDSVDQFVAQEMENFLADFTRNLMLGQPHHIEIVNEKKAIHPIVVEIGREFCMPVTTGAGYSSLPPRDQIKSRYVRSGKSKLILLMLTDFDPDGDEIAASFARSMRDDLGVRNVHPIKVALTAEDIEENDFPSDMDAKRSSPNYKKFLKRHGTNRAVELDAAPVEFLQSKLRDAIEGVLDVDEFKRQVEQEKADAAHIEAYRRVVFAAINSVKTP